MSSGIVRRFDALGRLVIPKEIRKRCGIDSNNRDQVEFFVENTLEDF